MKAGLAPYVFCLALLIGPGGASDLPFVFGEDISISSYTAEQLEELRILSPQLAGIPSLTAPSDDEVLVISGTGAGSQPGAGRAVRAGELKELFDSRVEPHHSEVRRRALSIAAGYSEECSIRQICRIYDYMKKGDDSTRDWIYISDPRDRDYYSYANETLKLGQEIGCVGAGDCDDFAILMSALIEAVGGTSRIVLAYNNSSGHAYAEVYLGRLGQEDRQAEECLRWLTHKYFLTEIYTHIDAGTGEVWLNMDWGAGERGVVHPGGPFFKGDRHIILRLRDESLKSPLKLPEEYHRALAWYREGWNLSRKGEYEEAMPYLDRALELDPQNSFAWAEKGDAFTGLHQYDRAIEAFDRSLQIDPYRAWTLNGKGIALIGQKKYPEALECFDKALDIDPGFTPACSGRGYALYDMGRYEEAIRAHEAALSLDPTDSAIDWRNIGRALQKLGRFAEAQEAFRKAEECEIAERR